MGTGEVLRMPCVPKGRDHLTNDRFAAKFVMTIMMTMVMTIVTCKQRTHLSASSSPPACSCPPEGDNQCLSRRNMVIKVYQGGEKKPTCKFPSMSSRLGAPPITGSSTLRSSILKLFKEVIRSSSSAVAVEALVESGTMVVWDCLWIKMIF